MTGALHSELTLQAARFFMRNGCEMVATEFSTRLNACSGDHVFDVIGLDLHLNKVRVAEAKSSRSDFLSDPKIWNSAEGYTAVADSCYLICPEGLVAAAELPPGWGLIYHCLDRSALFYKDAAKRRRKTLVARADAREARAAMGDRYTHTRRVDEALVIIRKAPPVRPLRPLSREWTQLVRALGRKLTRHYLGVPASLIG